MYAVGKTQTYSTFPKTIVIFLHNQWFAPFTWKHMNGALIIFAPSRHKKPGKNRIFALQWQADISCFMPSFLHTYL